MALAAIGLSLSAVASPFCESVPACLAQAEKITNSKQYLAAEGRLTHALTLAEYAAFKAGVSVPAKLETQRRVVLKRLIDIECRQSRPEWARAYLYLIDESKPVADPAVIRDLRLSSSVSRCLATEPSGLDASERKYVGYVGLGQWSSFVTLTRKFESVWHIFAEQSHPFPGSGSPSANDFYSAESSFNADIEFIGGKGAIQRPNSAIDKWKSIAFEDAPSLADSSREGCEITIELSSYNSLELATYGYCGFAHGSSFDGTYFIVE